MNKKGLGGPELVKILLIVATLVAIAILIMSLNGGLSNIFNLNIF